LDPAAVEVDGGDHSVPTEVADVLAHHFAKAFFVWRELANGKRVDVDDANFFIGLDDAVADDAVVAARASRRVRASRLSELAPATATE
jgi:hypothetical protein